MSQPLVDIDRFEAQFDGLLEGLQKTLFHKKQLEYRDGEWYKAGFSRGVWEAMLLKESFWQRRKRCGLRFWDPDWEWIVQTHLLEWLHKLSNSLNTGDPALGAPAASPPESPSLWYPSFSSAILTWKPHLFSLGRTRRALKKALQLGQRACQLDGRGRLTAAQRTLTHFVKKEQRRLCKKLGSVFKAFNAGDLEAVKNQLEQKKQKLDSCSDSFWNRLVKPFRNRKKNQCLRGLYWVGFLEKIASFIEQPQPSVAGTIQAEVTAMRNNASSQPFCGVIPMLRFLVPSCLPNAFRPPMHSITENATLSPEASQTMMHCMQFFIERGLHALNQRTFLERLQFRKVVKSHLHVLMDRTPGSAALSLPPEFLTTYQKLIHLLLHFFELTQKLIKTLPGNLKEQKKELENLRAQVETRLSVEIAKAMEHPELWVLGKINFSPLIDAMVANTLQQLTILNKKEHLIADRDFFDAICCRPNQSWDWIRRENVLFRHHRLTTAATAQCESRGLKQPVQAHLLEIHRFLLRWHDQLSSRLDDLWWRYSFTTREAFEAHMKTCKAEWLFELQTELDTQFLKVNPQLEPIVQILLNEALDAGIQQLKKRLDKESESFLSAINQFFFAFSGNRYKHLHSLVSNKKASTRENYFVKIVELMVIRFQSDFWIGCLDTLEKKLPPEEEMLAFSKLGKETNKTYSKLLKTLYPDKWNDEQLSEKENTSLAEAWQRISKENARFQAFTNTGGVSLSLLTTEIESVKPDDKVLDAGLDSTHLQLIVYKNSIPKTPALNADEKKKRLTHITSQAKLLGATFSNEACRLYEEYSIYFSNDRYDRRLTHLEGTYKRFTKVLDDINDIRDAVEQCEDRSFALQLETLEDERNEQLERYSVLKSIPKEEVVDNGVDTFAYFESYSKLSNDVIDFIFSFRKHLLLQYKEGLQRDLQRQREETQRREEEVQRREEEIQHKEMELEKKIQRRQEEIQCKERELEEKIQRMQEEMQRKEMEQGEKIPRQQEELQRQQAEVAERKRQLKALKALSREFGLFAARGTIAQTAQGDTPEAAPEAAAASAPTATEARVPGNNVEVEDSEDHTVLVTDAQNPESHAEPPEGEPHHVSTPR